MKKILLLLLPVYLFSCIWINGTTIDGEHEYQGFGYIYANVLKETIEYESPQSKLKDILEERKDKKVSADELSEDDAVILMLQGKYEESIKKLLELNQRHPNKYSIASNLGTVYELNGENEKALKWITEGIKRDANSHYGTEWLHQLILKLKIEERQNKNFLQTKRAIPLPEKFNLDDNITIDNQTHTISDIQKALGYQLRERLVFVKPKEQIVADLLYAHARIEAQLSTVEEGLKYLELAELYGFANSKLLEEKRAYYQDIVEHHSLSYYLALLDNPNTIWEVIVTVVFIALLGILLILLKRLIFGRGKK